MARHYILDGYNIIKQIPFFADVKLKKGREALVYFLENRRPQGSRNNKVTVVFDGKSGMGSDEQAGWVGVQFSRDESADEKIKRIVADADNNSNIIVVTDDRAIQYYVRSLGAMTIGVKAFMQKANSSNQKDGGRDKDSSRLNKGISHVAENKIFEEFSGIWLNKNN
ncbi:MAG: NYN domain-containing protein [Candidatus Omnitrophica bacterium]|nr:NYN domain-containing protein [Candidatus Omnitrophota bacterium]